MITDAKSTIGWVGAGVVLLALGATGGYWWAHRAMAPNEPAAAQIEGADSADLARESAEKGRVLYWHDPMVPNVKFDKPGKSPFMNMQLVPVYADESGVEGGVRISSSVVQNLGIRLGRVERATIDRQLRVVGNVAFDDRLLEVLQARVEGYVTKLYVKAPLERVKRGQPLAEILAPQWLEAQQDYLSLLDASAERAQTLRDAARQRLVLLGVPDETIRALETTRNANTTTTVLAPVDGVVTELGVQQGGAFMPGALLFRINGLSTVWVNAQVPEANVSLISTGTAVEARATGWPGTPFKGEVIGLLPDVDPQTRTLTARVALKNPDRKLSPGMYVTVDFAGAPGEPQLVVPSEAIIATGERTVVIVAREDSAFEVVNVAVGAEVGDRTTILSGLTEGQSIVLSGQFLIDSEASLRSTVNRLESARPPPASDDRATSPADEHAGRTSAASDGATSLQHLARGKVTAIAPGEITIAHEPVPSLDWPSMTMGFALPPRRMPQGLKVGDPVSFSFTAKQGGGFQIEDIAVLDAPTEAGKPQ